MNVIWMKTKGERVLLDMREKTFEAFDLEKTKKKKKKKKSKRWDWEQSKGKVEKGQN